MKSRCRFAVCLTAFAVSLSFAAGASAAPFETVLVSRANGANGALGDGYSAEPAISGDGRYVAFVSYSKNLGGPADGTGGVFVRDVVTGATTLVSRANGASGAIADDSSYAPSISADGRQVAFSSYATNLGGHTTGDTDVYVRDLVDNTTTLVSRATGAGGALADDSSYAPSISADGKHVAFKSVADNLGGHADLFTADVYVRDLVGHTTTLVSRATGASGALADGSSSGPAISGDGRYVAFDTIAQNLGDHATGMSGDVYVRDVSGATTTLVSRGPGVSGAVGDDYSAQPAISADGRYVAFESFATTLVAGDDNAHRDVFVRDLVSGTTELVSRAAGLGGALGNDDSDSTFRPSLSAHGECVAFQTKATNLVPGDTNGSYDVFVRDRMTHNTELVSRASGAGGALGGGDSMFAAISADFRYAAFQSDASNLVPGDGNASQDVFRRELAGLSTTCATSPGGGPPGGGPPGGGNPGGGPPGGGNPGGGTPLPPLDPARSFVLPASKTCVSRRSFRIRVRKIPAVTWVSATIKVNGKRVDTVKGKRLTAAISLKKLPAGRFTVQITAKARDGRTVTGTRKYRTCAKKRKSRGPRL